MAKKKTLPKTLKQKAVSLFASEKEEYAFYLKEYKEKYLPKEFNQLELLDELCNDEIDHYMSITSRGDRKSTRLNSSHVSISYAVFCLKKKKKKKKKTNKQI